MLRELRETWLLTSTKRKLQVLGILLAAVAFFVGLTWFTRNWQGAAIVPAQDESGELLAAAAPVRGASAEALLAAKLGTAEREVLDRHFAAIGGVRRINSVASLRSMGEVTFADGTIRSVQVARKAGGRIRVLINMPPMHIVLAIAPKDAWRATWRMGLLEKVEDLIATEAASLRREAFLVSQLFFAMQNDWKVRYLGKQPFNYKVSHVFEVEFSRTEKLRFFIDPVTFLESGREEWVVRDGGGLDITRQIVLEYFEVDGLKLPGKVESQLNGVLLQTFVVSQVELNPGILDASFDRPEIVEAPAATP